MTIFNILPGGAQNKQNDNAYFNQFTAVHPTGQIPENRPNIRYNKSLVDQDQNSSTYNTYFTPNNNTNSITIDWTAQSIRNFKYNILLNEFDPGYPLNYTYNLCDQKLASVFSLGSYRHVSVDHNVSTSYPQNHSSSIVQDNNNNPLLCAVPPLANCQNVICPSGFTFDPTTCLCSPPTECVPQDGCQPTDISVFNIKSKIYGYAFYLDRVREINIPDIGLVKSSCAGGHACNGTLFRPTIVFGDGSRLEANRNISMNNGGGRDDGTQIPVPGFQPENWGSLSYERSDTFEFVLDDTSLLNTANLELKCQYGRCHNGVTFVVLVGETADTNEKVLLFSSCVAPGSINSKVIGTIDCDNEPIPCEPPVTPIPTPVTSPIPTQTPTPTPTPTPIPNCTQCLEPYFFGRGGASGEIDFTTTITVPPEFDLPVIVNINGDVDDVLLKDDQPWPPGTSLDSAAYSFNYTWTENNRTFTLAALDTKGGGIGWSATVCFTHNRTPCTPPLSFSH